MQTKSKPVVMDFDDLCDNTVDNLDYLCLLKPLMPNLKVTLFAIPARCSPATIAAAKSLGPWVSLGMHGWQHTLGECLSWTSEDAIARMQAAAAMGIDGGVFRAPKWVVDAEIYYAAKAMDWIIADHKDFRVLGSGARTYTYNQPLRDPKVIRVHGHLPNVANNGIADHFDDFVFKPETEFKFITEIA
jgi:hypothetical protein